LRRATDVLFTTGAPPAKGARLMTNESVLGYQISRRGLVGDVDLAQGLLRERQGVSSVACANPHSLVVAREDREFAAALRSSTLLLPDGIGIVLAGRMLGRPFPERVAGYEFFATLTRRLDDAGGARYFFLGSTPEVLARIEARIAKEHCAMTVAGTCSPAYRDVFTAADDEEMVRAVNAAAPDVLWVGMTAPKQEKWIERNRSRLQVPLVVGIGAVFDFYAGTRPRAPQWVCDAGLEWLPRLVREPRRLWRRSVVSAPAFVFEVLREKSRSRSAAHGLGVPPPAQS
jgi:N-acetylglucosaminyldiphosphoundecaprenol N-acetyl-beta-D-mannosaminyltransferase